MARRSGSSADITGPRIREAALRLFARHGYAAVSMRRIAAEVGVQAGALYLYTPDKQTLLFDLMRTHLEELLAAWEAEEKGETPAERLDRFARFHIRFHIERPEAVFLSNMELRNLTPENFAVIEALRHRYEDALEEILKDGVAAQVFDVADTRLTTMALIAMLTGVTTWYREGGRLRRGRVEAIYAHMVRKAVQMPRWKRRQMERADEEAAPEPDADVPGATEADAASGTMPEPAAEKPADTGGPPASTSQRSG